MKVKLRIHVNIHIFVLIMHFSCNCLCIYKQWQEFAKTRNVAALIDLYNNEAVFESPLVPAILDKLETGILTGRAQILHFLEEDTKRRPNKLFRWYRTGKYLADGHTLIWEYPRATPEGDQIDILELIEIEQGKIKQHRIYWRWKGLIQIAPALVK